MSKTIIVPTNAHMSYIVSKEGYSTIKGDVIVDEDKVIDVALEEQTGVTFTINPTPSDAVVTLTANGYAQEGNSITVEPGTSVSYNVSKEGYLGVNDNIVVNEDKVVDVVLEDSTATLAITYDGSNVVDFKITDDNGNILHQHEYYDDTPVTITFDRNIVKTLYLTDLSSNPGSSGDGVMEYSVTGCDASGDGPYYYELTLTNLTQSQTLYLYFFYGPL